MSWSCGRCWRLGVCRGSRLSQSMAAAAPVLAVVNGGWWHCHAPAARQTHSSLSRHSSSSSLATVPPGCAPFCVHAQAVPPATKRATTTADAAGAAQNVPRATSATMTAASRARPTAKSTASATQTAKVRQEGRTQGRCWCQGAAAVVPWTQGSSGCCSCRCSLNHRPRAVHATAEPAHTHDPPADPHPTKPGRHEPRDPPCGIGSYRPGVGKACVQCPFPKTTLRVGANSEDDCGALVATQASACPPACLPACTGSA